MKLTENDFKKDEKLMMILCLTNNLREHDISLDFIKQNIDPVFEFTVENEESSKTLHELFSMQKMLKMMIGAIKTKKDESESG